MTFSGFEFIMEVRHIKLVMDKVPGTLPVHMVDANDTTRGSVLERGAGNCADSKVDRFLERHVIAVIGI